MPIMTYAGSNSIMNATVRKGASHQSALVIRSAKSQMYVFRMLLEYNIDWLCVKAERRALDAKQAFDHVSKLVKSEVARFEQERIEDFKISLEKFLDGMILRQKEVRCERRFLCIFDLRMLTAPASIQLIASRENFQQQLLKKVPSGHVSNGSITTAV